MRAVVLQSSGFYPRLTVREAVEHFAKAYPAPRDPGETIDMVGLGEKADTRSGQLSGGQRRRLDLALALVGDPELVFLDEPTTGFDPAARRTAWNAVRRLKELGKTVLLTTHYLEEAQALADRVAIVKDGRIVAEGPPSEVGSGRSRYRVSYMSNGRRVELETDDPTELLHRLTGTRSRAASGSRGSRSPARASRTCTWSSRPRGQREPAGPRLGAVPARAQALLAQPERGLLQLHAAAPAAPADRVGVLEQRQGAQSADSRHRRA